MPHTRTTSPLLYLFFAFLIFVYAGLGFFLIWHIPYTYPFGGPDELMHLSMADYIAKHLSWPDWDAPEVVRNAYGISYSAGGSIVYWLHGLSFKVFGYHRIGAFILLLAYLLLAVWAYRKNKLAGFLLLAGLLPQTLFIFSYVNSDSGTIITAVLIGLAVGFFVTGEENHRNFLLFFFFAGLAVTARQHLWAIAFLTFVWALVYKRRTWLKYDKKYWIIALLVALLPASWWFVTSYLANDGDILGTFTTAKSIAKFGQPGLPSLARAWSDLSISDFLYSTLISLYANWGWMSLPLHAYEYMAVGIVALLVIILLWKKIDKKIYGFFILLVLANFGFMLLYSTYYDYQAQGRYLFPSIYIVLGMIAAILITQKSVSKPLLVLLVLLSLQNVYFSTKLTLFSYVDAFHAKPVPWEGGQVSVYADAALTLDQLQVIDGKLLIRGWIFDKSTHHPFKNVQLILKQGETFYQTSLDQVERPDVAAAFGNSALRSSGFSARLIDLTSLPKGQYGLLMLAEKNGKPVLIDLKKEMRL